MTSAEARWQHVATLLTAVTGIAYGWTLYFAESEDPFSLVNHPWQPGLRAGHIVVSPLLVFALGLIWSDHVWSRIRSGFPARRRSGWLLFGSALPMILSGYALQVSSGELARTAWLTTHLVSSGLWVLSYGLHQLSRRPRPPRR